MFFAIACVLTATNLAAQTSSLSLYAAGSLRLAFDDIIALYAARSGRRFLNF
jgi:ABC-type molybdate transport system substrate-binding protein